MRKTKRITAAVLAAMLLALSLFSAYAEPQTKTEIYSENSAGETVVRIQIRLRELGYLWFKPTGVYRAMTVKAVEEFQTRCVAYGERLGVDGRMGEQSMLELFAPSAPKFRIPDSVHLPRGPIADTLKVKGEVQSSCSQAGKTMPRRSWLPSRNLKLSTISAEASITFLNVPLL